MALVAGASNKWHAPFRPLVGQEIRLLSLEPGYTDYDDPVRCSFVHADPTIDEFEALSYTWADKDGDKSLCQSIILKDYCNDGRFLVTRNCLAALKRVRYHSSSWLLNTPPPARRVWVDSVCIFQNDDAERTHQVSMMADIYSKAQCVLVFVGEHVQNLDGVTSGLVEHQWETRSDHQNIPEEGLNSPQANMLRQFFSDHAYFQRLWVVQEVALARELELMLPGRTVRFHYPHRAFTNSAMRAGGPLWLKSINKMSQGTGDGHRLKLWEFIYSTAKVNCSDKRDKVYALLGIYKSGDGTRTLLSDYSLNETQLAIRATAHMLCIEGTGEVLAYSAGHRGSQRGLPSWALDFDALVDRKKSFTNKDSVPPDMIHRVVPKTRPPSWPNVDPWIAPWDPPRDWGAGLVTSDETRGHLKVSGKVLTRVVDAKSMLLSEESTQGNEPTGHTWWELATGRQPAGPSTIYFCANDWYEPTDADFLFAPDFHPRMTLLIRKDENSAVQKTHVLLQHARIAMAVEPSSTTPLKPIYHYIWDSWYKRSTVKLFERYSKSLVHEEITLR